MIVVAYWMRAGHGLGMKRYFVYYDDVTESEHGEWVKWEDSQARVAELERLNVAANAQSDLFAERARNLEVQWRGASSRAEAEERQVAEWKGQEFGTSEYAREVKEMYDAVVQDAERAESEAAALRARIDRAVEVFALAYGSSPYHWPQAARDALEILRAGDK